MRAVGRDLRQDRPCTRVGRTGVGDGANFLHGRHLPVEELALVERLRTESILPNRRVQVRALPRQSGRADVVPAMGQQQVHVRRRQRRIDVRRGALGADFVEHVAADPLVSHQFVVELLERRGSGRIELGKSGDPCVVRRLAVCESLLIIRELRTALTPQPVIEDPAPGVIARGAVLAFLAGPFEQVLRAQRSPIGAELQDQSVRQKAHAAAERARAADHVAARRRIVCPSGARHRLKEMREAFSEPARLLGELIVREVVRDLVRDELAVRLPAFDRHDDQRVSPPCRLEERAPGARAGEIFVVTERSGHQHAHPARDFDLLAEQPLDDERAQLLEVFQQDLRPEARHIGIEEEMGGLVLPSSSSSFTRAPSRTLPSSRSFSTGGVSGGGAFWR